MRLGFKFLRILPLSAVLLSACSVPQRTSDYPAQAAQQLDEVPIWSQADNAAPTAYLNQLIHSELLDALLKEALTANPSLQQTLLTLKIRRAEQRQTEAERRPSVEAEFTASKEQGSRDSSTGSFIVSWEADLWGQLDDNTRAAAKDVATQRALYQAARDTLAAEVIESWLGSIAGKRAIDVEQRRLETLVQNERFILQRYRNGLGPLEDLDSARTSVASSRATLEEYRESLAQLERALQELLGRTARTAIDIPSGYPEVGRPLAGLPQQTLQRRPDLQAAYLAIEAANLRISVAYKNLLPRIDIQAALTPMIDSPHTALFTDPVWSLLAQLTAPLYQGGRLKAAVKIAELETAQAYQAYRETLLTAVTEVGDALGQERALSKQKNHIEMALASARNNLAQYQRSYRTGLVSVLDLLTVQRQTYDLESQLDNLIYQRLVNRVDLGLALGLGINLEEHE